MHANYLLAPNTLSSKMRRRVSGPGVSVMHATLNPSVLPSGRLSVPLCAGKAVDSESLFFKLQLLLLEPGSHLRTIHARSTSPPRHFGDRPPAYPFVNSPVLKRWFSIRIVELMTANPPLYCQFSLDRLPALCEW